MGNQSARLIEDSIWYLKPASPSKPNAKPPVAAAPRPAMFNLGGSILAISTKQSRLLKLPDPLLIVRRPSLTSTSASPSIQRRLAVGVPGELSVLPLRSDRRR